MMALLLDTLLALVLIVLAWQVVVTPTVFRSILVFIVFGLVMALVWTRLQAPDLALAEAAIGAGITGVLLLKAYQSTLRPDSKPAAGEPAAGEPVAGESAAGALAGFKNSTLLAVLAVGLALVIAWSTLNLPPAGLQPGAEALALLDRAGASNPVTAVLLNFRSYDTLLEKGVLLLAVLGVWTVAGREWRAVDDTASNPLLAALTSVLVPLTVFLSGYLFWAGSSQPGGAFQSGAVLAAGFVLLCLAGRLLPTPDAPLWQRGLLVLGPMVFALIGLAMMTLGLPALTLPPAWAATLIYAIEVVMVISVAMSMLLLFLVARGVRRP
jgi:multisubunit Na+/H+ antiporter MnhB subunit